MSETEWPTFEEPFLEAVKECVRQRSGDLWYRGRLFIEGDSGAGVLEHLIVSLDLRGRRVVTMRLACVSVDELIE